MTAIDILKMRLGEVKKDKQTAMDKILGEYDPAIRSIEKAISHLDSICPSCDGTGSERYTDAAGSRDERDCKSCGGTGKRRR